MIHGIINITRNILNTIEMSLNLSIAKHGVITLRTIFMLITTITLYEDFLYITVIYIHFRKNFHCHYLWTKGRYAKKMNNIRWLDKRLFIWSLLSQFSQRK